MLSSYDFVLDASVAAKWFLPAKDEPFSTEALSLYERYLHDDIGFIIPDIFWAEIGSILWKATRLGRLQKDPAEAPLSELMECEFTSFPSTMLLKKAFEISTTFNRSFYGCLYVALAAESNVPLLTADERLANSLAARFPIRWVGAI